jgi:hypothetical protein
MKFSSSSLKLECVPSSSVSGGYESLLILLLKVGERVFGSREAGGHESPLVLLQKVGKRVSSSRETGGYESPLVLLLEVGKRVSSSRETGGYEGLLVLLLKVGECVSSSREAGGYESLLVLLLFHLHVVDTQSLLIAKNTKKSLFKIHLLKKTLLVFFYLYRRTETFLAPETANCRALKLQL